LFLVHRDTHKLVSLNAPSHRSFVLQLVDRFVASLVPSTSGMPLAIFSATSCQLFGFGLLLGGAGDLTTVPLVSPKSGMCICTGLTT
jgi:hypothetical protein